MGHKLQKFSRGGLPTPPAVGRGFAPPAAFLFVRNYIKNREKVLKNASFGVINSKNFRGGSSDPPCTPAQPSHKLTRRKLHKKRGKGLKNASFGVKNSKNFRGGVFRHPCRRKLIRRGKKMISKEGGGPENDRIAQYIPL